MAGVILEALLFGFPYVLAWWLSESVKWEQRNG
jgi:hypothetical protein